MSNYILADDGELYHHGIKGQRWGVRRYQNADGTLTNAGKKRYISNAEAKRNAKQAAKDSIAKDREAGVSIYRAHRNARQARLDSIHADKEYNRQLRESRKTQTRQAKDAYKSATNDAYKKYLDSTKKADDDYERDMSAKKLELERVKKEFDVKDAETKKYYNAEIDKHLSAAKDAKRSMDFWSDRPNSTSYKSAESRYNDETKAVRDLETRRDATIYANSFARDNATIKVHELFNSSSEQAESKRASAYAEAGRAYADKVTAAKEEYRKAKQRID